MILQTLALILLCVILGTGFVALGAAVFVAFVDPSDPS
jgi:hypothetical protein